MADTAGTKLQRARKLRQLSIEDAARATKMRVSQIADLESDDYSNFANLAYARGFLVGYGKYLHVDVRPYLDAFSDNGSFGIDDYQYLSEEPVGMYRAPARPFRRRGQQRQFAVLGALTGALALTACVWFAVITIRRLPDWDKLAARQEARERAEQAAPAATEAAAPRPAPVAAEAPAVIVPISAPAPAVENAPTAPAPAPTASAAPLEEVARPPVPALALTQNAPPAAAAHVAAAPQTQKVVNEHPRE